MKNYISNFPRFINESIDESSDKHRHRDTMVYLMPRAYRITVKLNSEFSGENQSRNEGILTSKFNHFNQDKVMFRKHDGVNIVGDTAYLKLKTVFTEDLLKSLIETIFSEAIGGEINIEETSDDEFSNGRWHW